MRPKLKNELFYYLLVLSIIMIYQLDQINSGKKNSKKPFSGDFYEISGDQKWSEGSISQGMTTGWVKCHLNGNKKSVQVWQGGKHEGVQTKMHSNGNKFIEMEYKKGQELSSSFRDRKGKNVNCIKEAKH